MFLADECTLVMGCWWFGWRAPLRPGHTPLAALRWLAPLSLCERGVGGWWGFCGDVLVGCHFVPGSPSP